MRRWACLAIIASLRRAKGAIVLAACAAFLRAFPYRAVFEARDPQDPVGAVVRSKERLESVLRAGEPRVT